MQATGNIQYLRGMMFEDRVTNVVKDSETLLDRGKIERTTERRQEIGRCGPRQATLRQVRNLPRAVAVYGKAPSASGHSLILVRIIFYPISAGQKKGNQSTN